MVMLVTFTYNHNHYNTHTHMHTHMYRACINLTLKNANIKYDLSEKSKEF